MAAILSIILGIQNTQNYFSEINSAYDPVQAYIYDCEEVRQHIYINVNIQQFVCVGMYMCVCVCTTFFQFSPSCFIFAL